VVRGSVVIVRASWTARSRLSSGMTSR